MIVPVIVGPALAVRRVPSGGDEMLVATENASVEVGATPRPTIRGKERKGVIKARAGEEGEVGRESIEGTVVTGH